jgi:hypothetical protein
MYAKNVTVKYFKGTGEYFVVIDGSAMLYPTLKEALREASAEFAREAIRYERVNPDVDIHK